MTTVARVKTLCMRACAREILNTLIKQYEYLIRQYENLSMGNEKRGKIRGNDIASSVIVSYCLESEWSEYSEGSES